DVFHEDVPTCREEARGATALSSAGRLRPSPQHSTGNRVTCHGRFIRRPSGRPAVRLPTRASSAPWHAPAQLLRIERHSSLPASAAFHPHPTRAGGSPHVAPLDTPADDAAGPAARRPSAAGHPRDVAGRL